MLPIIDPEKLADIEAIHEKLQKADRDTLIYIHGRVDQAAADSSKDADKKQPAKRLSLIHI